MGNRLFKVKNPDKAICAVGWLAAYGCHDFGKKKVQAILDEADVAPIKWYKDKQGKDHPLYSLEEALAAIRQYRLRINAPSRVSDKDAAKAMQRLLDAEAKRSDVLPPEMVKAEVDG